MLNRRGLLKAVLFAPVVVPSVNLMGLSRQSSNLLTPLKFSIVKTTVRARSRQLADRWTFEEPQDMMSIMNDTIADDIAEMLRHEIDQEIIAAIRRASVFG